MPQLLQAVEQAGYKAPSPIQQKAIPPVLAGRDLLGCAQTGTGKTAAFALPILQLLAQKPAKQKTMRALILTPTRELALQIYENFLMYGKHLPLKAAVIFGGVGQNPQVAALKRGVDILVATPGRLNDLANQGHINFANVEIFVLDEADRMLDMGFIHDVKKVLKRLPEQKQTLLFSATIPKEIVKLASGLLHNPAKVFVTPPSTTVKSIQQTLYKVDKTNKRHLLAHLLKSQNIPSALVFTRTKHGADRVVRELTRAGIKAMAIHGNKGQTARQAALAKFKEGQIKVLVATDIAARGIDIEELPYVFNYDLPNIPETYVHRIGRTGRAGHAGQAINFCCTDELEYLADIEKLIGFTLPEQKNHNWPLQGDAQPAATAPPAPTTAPKPKRAPKVAAPGKQPLSKPGKSAPASKPSKTPAQTTPAKTRPARGGKPASIPAPYSNLPAGRNIVTKRPVWATAPQDAPTAKGDEDTMPKNNNRNRKRGKPGKGTPPPKANAPKKEKLPEIPKTKNGIFDFSETELAEDNALKVISRGNSEAKYASFEDFLKDR